MNKLRFALGDSADNSRFILTVARGYQFIAPVERTNPELAPLVVLPEARFPAGPVPSRSRSPRSGFGSRPGWSWRVPRPPVFWGGVHAPSVPLTYARFRLENMAISEPTA